MQLPYIKLTNFRYASAFIVNKSDDPTIIFFKTSFFWDKGSSCAKCVLPKHMIFHFDLLLGIFLALVQRIKVEIIKLTPIHVLKDKNKGH